VIRSILSLSLIFFDTLADLTLTLQRYPEWENRLMESHPEYCFALSNSGKTVLES
jgi:predicted RNase H-like nuclease